MEPCLDAWYFTKSRDQVKVHHPNVTEVLRHLQHTIPTLVELGTVMKKCLEILVNSVVHPDYHHHRVVLIIATYVASLYLGRQFVGNPKHDCSKERWGRNCFKEREHSP
ncbi:hypothetical protein CTI12_AA351990 [Artemisia annua]|uniref:Uncharacterized protein n=1 Tax=Artemisia annua TaxID=35608 RepID=A0A2U1LA96_ARTAN|nr:hypothetical protein CTI12_AA351990 [Artemisia annua]